MIRMEKSKKMKSLIRTYVLIVLSVFKTVRTFGTILYMSLIKYFGSLRGGEITENHSVRFLKIYVKPRLKLTKTKSFKNFFNVIDVWNSKYKVPCFLSKDDGRKEL